MNYLSSSQKQLKIFKENLYFEIDKKQIDLATKPELEILAGIMADNIAIQMQARIAGDEIGRVEWKVPKTWWQHVKMAFYRSPLGLWLYRNSWIFKKIKDKHPTNFFMYNFDIKSYYPLIPINGTRPNIVVDRIDSMIDWQRESGAFPAENSHVMHYQEYYICPRCKGTGYLVKTFPDPLKIDDKCEICNGLGSIPSSIYKEPYEVKSSDNRKDSK